MVSIEPYTGSAEELADFVGMVWSRSYAGKMVFPRWTADYFRWQFRQASTGVGDNLLAAYEGSTLVGVSSGTDYSFRTPSGVVPGSHWSWLSVHPDHQRKGIAPALDQERIRRQQANGSELMVSYRYLGSHSLAERPNANSPSKVFLKTLGLWARVLSPDRFARWHYSRLEGVLARMAVPLLRVRSPLANDPLIREFVPEELNACLQLVQASQQAAALAIHWTPETLLHHLTGSPVSQTLVLEESGRVTGLVNFHVLPFEARTVENVGVFDVIAFRDATGIGQSRLIHVALSRMVAQDAILALKLRCGDTPIWPLLRNVFVPHPPDHSLVLQWMNAPVEIPARSKLHLLWR